VGIDLAEPMPAEAAALEPDPLEPVVRFGRRTVHCHGGFDFVNIHPNGDLPR
jgi:hypothetical protein